MVRFTVEDNKIVIAPGIIVYKDQAYFLVRDVRRRSENQKNNLKRESILLYDQVLKNW